MEQLFVGWNILHRDTVMRKADIALCVHDTTQGHASQLEEIHLLPVHARHAMVGIGQADEWNSFILPILFEGGRGIGSDSQDLGSAACEFIIFITQARQLRAAVRSHEAAQKCKNNRFVVAKTGKFHLGAVHILELEIGREFPRGNQFGHRNISQNSYLNSQNCPCGIPAAGNQEPTNSYLTREARSLTVASATCVHCSSGEIVASLSPA